MNPYCYKKNRRNGLFYIVFVYLCVKSIICMREENPKFRQIVDTAKSLFWKYGIKRVSIEEVCREANVSKMTFYKYFGNKTGLAKYIIDKVIEKGIREYRKIMDSDLPFEDKVNETIKLKMNQTHDISQEFLNDLYKNEETELQEFFKGKVQKSFEMIHDDYEKAREKGEIRSDIKIEFILYFLNRMLEMTTDERITRFYENAQDMIREFTKFFFYGILPLKDRKNNDKTGK